jgi:hypothetical protein
MKLTQFMENRLKKNLELDLKYKTKNIKKINHSVISSQKNLYKYL